MDRDHRAARLHTGISGQALWAVTVGDGKERRLTPDSLRVGELDVSPNGAEVVYEVLRGGGVSDLQVMPVAGGAARALVAGTSNSRQPNWSPDGKSIGFLSNRSGSSDVWIVPAAGGHTPAAHRLAQLRVEHPVVARWLRDLLHVEPGHRPVQRCLEGQGRGRGTDPGHQHRRHH